MFICMTFKVGSELSRDELWTIVGANTFGIPNIVKTLCNLLITVIEVIVFRRIFQSQKIV